MVAVLGTYVAVAALALALQRRLGLRVLPFAALAPAVLVGWLVGPGRAALDEPLTETVRWVDPLGLELGLRLDGLGYLLCLLIGTVGVAVLCFSRRYLDHHPEHARIAPMLVLFSGAMFGLVVSDNVFALYTFWELTAITSFVLIGTEDGAARARYAALQAILVTVAGGLALLAGLVLLGLEAGTWSVSGILAARPATATAGIGVALVLVGAFTKSAQVPFHGWLPGAMAAPTPISAYLHSATMVKAGVYLVARLAPAFSPGLSWFTPVVVGIGGATMLWGGYQALRRNDLKLLLAYGTVSQLGFLIATFGVGSPDMAVAGVALLLAHGLFKSVLFLVVGIVDHETGTRDLRRLSGVAGALPGIAVTAAIAGASMAGLPPLAGFVAKEAALTGLFDAGDLLPLVVTGAGSVLTVAYTARFLWGAFATKPGVDAVATHGRPSPWLWSPIAVLTLPTVVLGIAPAVGDRILAAAAESVSPAVDAHLTLWHGLTPALVASVVIVAIGIGLFVAREKIAGAQARVALDLDPVDTFQDLVRGVLLGAARITGVVQNGSLPVYLGVILLTVVVVPGTVLLAGDVTVDAPVLAESPAQVVVAGLVIAGAIGAASVHRRFGAVLALGVAGTGVSMLFVIQGAPDLALTQILIEALTVVIFVLVLRHLPERFTPVLWRPGRVLRLVVAGLVGVFVTAFALIAGGARTTPPVSEAHLARSLPETGGRNVVNVILVDFRGFDTMGEITVLAVAALGIASLVSVARRTRGRAAPAVDAGEILDAAPSDPEPMEEAPHGR